MEKLFHTFKVKYLTSNDAVFFCFHFFFGSFNPIYIKPTLWFGTFVFTLHVNNNFNLSSCLSLFCRYFLKWVHGCKKYPHLIRFVWFQMKKEEDDDDEKHSLEKWKWNALNIFFLFPSALKVFACNVYFGTVALMYIMLAV